MFRVGDSYSNIAITTSWDKCLSSLNYFRWGWLYLAVFLLEAGSKAQIPVCTILSRTLSHLLCVVHMRDFVCHWLLPEMKLAALQALPTHSWLYALVSLFLHHFQEGKFLMLTVGVGVLCSAVFNGSVPLCQWAVHREEQEVWSQPGLQWQLWWARML